MQPATANLFEMRIFTGISLPESIVYGLESFLTPLRPLAKIRWSPSSNLHITTRFIGEWPFDRMNELCQGLASLGSRSFDIQLSGLGWFPNEQAPHVFWMGVEGGEALSHLAAANDAVLARLDWPREERPYRPHLTLARTRREAKLRMLRRALDENPCPVLPPFTVADYHLYQSDAGVYRKLETFQLVTFDARKIY